jgi:Myristoyl-CoA:protein N-myristoyltransferase, N-terminal domain
MNTFWRYRLAASRTYSTGSISANTESPGAGLDWCTIDELSNSALAEIQSLLDENYVADKLGGIRLIYPEALLRWILD